MFQHSFDIYAAILVAFTGWILVMISSLKRNLHILQLEDYESARMLHVVFSQPKRLPLLGFELIGGITVIIGSILRVPFRSSYGTLISFGLILWGLGCFWRYLQMRSSVKSIKKPLVMTARAKRIYIVSYLFPLIAMSCLLFLSVIQSWKPSVYCIFQQTSASVLMIEFIIIMYVIERLSPVWLSLSVLILKPYENAIQRNFMNDAKVILREVRPLVIGITGSYGKTGTKEILSAMLAEKYNVFKPPGSYNTLMGVTRIIREELRPYHEVFVAEMGAYRIGSIEKLCDLVQPTYGIITIIGLQHLERFKTQENIKIAKGELVQSLPDDGIAVLNGDDPFCREIGSDFNGKVIYFSVESDLEADRNPPEGGQVPSEAGQVVCPTEASGIRVENIRIGADGSDFDIVYSDGEQTDVHLSLLGRSAIYNAAAAAAMADQLGVPRKSIAKTLAAIPHVRHRLEPIKHEGGINVLDDAFNSNPIGAKNALEVLSAASGGRRILVTPGMVELGSMEEEANYEFGRQAADACDLAVLVGGQRIEPIKRGLLEAGFNADCIWVVDSLNDGLDALKSYLQPGDTMLLENDLPDQYDNT